MAAVLSIRLRSAATALMQKSIKCIISAKRHQTMRTTITLEDDAFATAQAYARSRALKLGQAVSELIRRGSAQRLPIKRVGGVWVFDLPPDTPAVTAQQVRAMLDESA
jgi:hypothetical protein